MKLRSEGLSPTKRDETNSRHLLSAGVGFMAFEAVFIWALGDKVYDFGYFSPVLWGMLALAAVGYGALGYFSRSWLSAPFLLFPLLVALYFVNVVWTTEFESGASISWNSNFVQVWFSYSIVFIPAWAYGVLKGG